MFSGLCGPMGLTGWIIMAVVWTGLIAVVVWAIARLFPERPTSPPPPPLDPAPPGAGERVERVSRDGSAARADVTRLGGQR